MAAFPNQLPFVSNRHHESQDASSEMDVFYSFVVEAGLKSCCVSVHWQCSFNAAKLYTDLSKSPCLEESVKFSAPRSFFAPCDLPATTIAFQILFHSHLPCDAH